MNRAFYSNSIKNFIDSSSEEIFNKLALNNQFALEQTQKDAWLEEIHILKEVLISYKNDGSIYLEFSIPRMGQRIDAVVIIGSVIFVLEFKIGEKEYHSYAIDQVMDYALDLKNFHESSHEQFIVPILIATKAKNCYSIIATTSQNDKLLFPIKSNIELFNKLINDVLNSCEGVKIDNKLW